MLVIWKQHQTQDSALSTISSVRVVASESMVGGCAFLSVRVLYFDVYFGQGNLNQSAISR